MHGIRTDEDLRVVYEEWGGMVLAYATRLLASAADAEDVTQQTFIAAWEQRRRFDTGRGQLPAWLLGVARNKVRDRLRASARQSRLGDRLRGRRGDAAEPADDGLADRLLVADTLRRLPDEQRRVLELAFYGQQTQPEIADQLGLPLGTVKSHARRGLERLRRQLDGTGR